MDETKSASTKGVRTPFHTYILKIASRCNLNCSYCFVYNAGDTSWQKQPKLMQSGTAQQIARRILEHARSNNQEGLRIVFHGGEPLMGGVAHLDKLISTIQTEFKGSGVQIAFGMQSNGVLLTLEMAKFLCERGVSVGISIDGPPGVHDLARVDHKGRATGHIVEANIRAINSSPYRSVLSGFLCVVNLDADPIALIDYFLGLEPAKIDFLLPYDNYERPPAAKVQNIDSTEYAKWLIRAFDYWFDCSPQLRIREFDSLIRQMLGGSPLVESIGLGEVDLIVVETDGSIEAVDSLKAAYDGAAFLGYNVFDHTFDVVAHDIRVRNRQMGASVLCKRCRDCDLVEICGGGYLPNRYSEKNQFLNPTIYCSDMQILIPHIYKRVSLQLNTLRE